MKRLLGYARHLPALGWRPLVLSREWHGVHEADPSWGLTWEPQLEAGSRCTIHRVACDPPAALRPARGRSDIERHWPSTWRKLAAKVTRLHALAFGNYPDEFIGWVEPAVAAGERLARRHRIDVVMSYCPPESNHLVARALAVRLGIPWVPFFGDLYGFLDPPLPRHSGEGWVRRRWHRWCLAPAAACAAVSPAMVSFLASAYGKPTHLIHTGFDAADFVDDRPSAPRERFRVAHVGSIYPGDQRPEILFDGLDRLLANHPGVKDRLEVRLVGSKCESQLHALLQGRLAASVCSVQPKVDSASAVALVRASDVLLAFTCTAHRDRYGTLSYPTKIFEALGARRPVLAIPADGDWVDALLRRTGGGTSAGDADAVAEILFDWFNSWKRDGQVPYDGIEPERAELTRRRQAERLAELFAAVSARDS